MGTGAAVIDQGVLEPIIARNKAWADPDKISDEALTLAPRDRKTLLAMVEKLLVEQLRLETENMALRTKLMEKLSRMTVLLADAKTLRLQRDVVRDLVLDIVEKVSLQNWPVGFLIHVKGLIEAWGKEGAAHANLHHGGNRGGQDNTGE